MKILLDANISWKLIDSLTHVYGECAHVDHIGLSVPAKDIDIWKYAKLHGYIIITKDNDFINLHNVFGFPPKIVLLRTGNNRKKDLYDLLIKIKPQLEYLESEKFGFLEIINL